MLENHSRRIIRQGGNSTANFASAARCFNSAAFGIATRGERQLQLFHFPSFDIASAFLARRHAIPVEKNLSADEKTRFIDHGSGDLRQTRDST